MHVILDTIDRPEIARGADGGGLRIFGSLVGQAFIDPRVRRRVRLPLCGTRIWQASWQGTTSDVISNDKS